MTNANATGVRATLGHFLLVIRSLVYWMEMALSILVFAPLAVLSWPLPFSYRYRFVSLWARLNLRCLRACCGLGYRVSGRENLPLQNAIVMAKHQSAWETLALQEILPPQTWVLKRELLWVPLFGWGLAVLEPIAIDRGAGARAVEQLVQQGIARLTRGRWVIIFPEGTRVPPGKRGRYRAGGALLAERSGYPVVPIAHNAGEYWPRRGFIKRPGRIQVHIGPPIASTGRKAADILADAERWIEDTMEKISRQDP